MLFCPVVRLSYSLCTVSMGVNNRSLFSLFYKHRLTQMFFFTTYRTTKCANALLTNAVPTADPCRNQLRLECRTCTYVHIVTTRIERPVANLPKKEVDDVLGGDASWATRDATQIDCPKCYHPKANFFQMQTRSADEPMTTFYRCQKCGNQWKEN